MKFVQFGMISADMDDYHKESSVLTVPYKQEAQYAT